MGSLYLEPSVLKLQNFSSKPASFFSGQGTQIRHSQTQTTLQQLYKFLQQSTPMPQSTHSDAILFMQKCWFTMTKTLVGGCG